MIRTRHVALLLLPLFLSGCGGISTTAPAAPPSNTESLSALKELGAVKEELKRLRNQVEELQYQADVAVRRERNLLDDLDRRLLTLERARRLGTVDAPGLPGVDAGDGDALTVPGEDALGAGEIPVTTGTAPGAALTFGDAQTASEPGLTVSAADASPQIAIDEQQAYDAAFSLLKESRFADAIAMFQKFADAWPQSQLADDAYYMLATAHQFNRENRAALTAFQNVVARYPDSDKTPDALLGIGDIHYNIGAYDEAAKVYREVLRRFPVHAVAVPAEMRLRRIEQTIQ